MSSPVLLVILQAPKDFEQDVTENLNALTANYATQVVLDTSSFQKAFQGIKPKVVILADNGMTLPDNADMRALLYDFTKEGGMVICSYKFAISYTEASLNTFFSEIGLLMWTRAAIELTAFTRPNLALNPAMKSVFDHQSYINMRETYPVKGVHLLGVEDKHKVLIPFSGDAGTIAAIPGHDSATTAAISRIGKGHVAFLGDFPLQFGTIRIMIAMIEKALAAPPITTPLTASSFAGGTPAQQGANVGAEDSEENDDEDFGLAEGLEGLELEEEDAFDKSWSE